MRNPQAVPSPEGAQLIVLIEPHFSLFRYPRVIHRKGYECLVLTSDPDAALAGEKRNSKIMGLGEESHIDLAVRYDEFSVDGLLDALAPYKSRVAGVLAGDDVVVPIATELGVALGFDYARPEDAQCHHLKTAMKQRLVDRGVRTPAYRVASSLAQAADAWEQAGRDCVMKMVDFSGSLNVFRIQTEDQLQRSWQTIADSWQEQGVFFERSRSVILEEFVGGRELTAEGYVQGDRIEILNFSTKLTKHFNVVGHYIPALVTPTEEQRLSEIAAQAVRALGIRNSLFHVEVHVEDGVPYVIECAARPPGGHVVELIEHSTGIDLMDVSVDLATGEEVNAKRGEPRMHFAILTLFAESSGVLERIEGLDELRRRGGVLHTRINVEPGAPVEALRTHRRRYGFVILGSESPHEVREKATWLRHNVRMVVSPS